MTLPPPHPLGFRSPRRDKEAGRVHPHSRRGKQKTSKIESRAARICPGFRSRSAVDRYSRRSESANDGSYFGHQATSGPSILPKIRRVVRIRRGGLGRSGRRSGGGSVRWSTIACSIWRLVRNAFYMNSCIVGFLNLINKLCRNHLILRKYLTDKSKSHVPWWEFFPSQLYYYSAIPAFICHITRSHLF